MKGFVQNSLILILLLGCASTPTDAIGVARREVIKSIEMGCLEDVFWGMQPDYPLTDYTTYRIWMEMGGSGPSPDEWCREYARSKVL